MAVAATTDPQTDSGPSQDPDTPPSAPSTDPAAPQVAYDADPSLIQAAPAGVALDADAAAGSPTPAAASPTVESLSAEIVNHMNQPTSRFDLTLNPETLGRVDVRLQIRADGRISAALTFGKSEAASSLSAHADELRASLAKAGFDLAPDALTFKVDAAVAGSAPQGGAGGGAAGRGQGDGGGRGQESGSGSGSRPSSVAAAFAASGAGEVAIATGYGGASARGLDIRV